MDTLSGKSEHKYSCAKCIYNTNNVYNFNKHIDTFNHKTNEKSGKS